jgi:hypothetical protein
VVRIFDNVLDNFDGYLDMAKNACYAPVVSQDMTFENIRLMPENNDVYDKIEKEFKPENVVNFLRVYKAGDENPTWVHADTYFADYIGIFFVQASQESDGVSLWKYKKTGEKMYTGIYPELIDADSKDVDKWDLWKTVEFKPNRLMVAPASYFHSKSTYNNVGNSIDNCRIVHVLFFNKRRL